MLRAAIWKENEPHFNIFSSFCFGFPRVQIAVDSRDMSYSSLFRFLLTGFHYVFMSSHVLFFFIFCFSLIFCTAAAAHTILRLIQFSTLIPSLRAVYIWASSLLHSQCNIQPEISTRKRCTTPIESLHNNQAANQIRQSLNSIKRKGDRGIRINNNNKLWPSNYRYSRK